MSQLQFQLQQNLNKLPEDLSNECELFFRILNEQHLDWAHTKSPEELYFLLEQFMVISDLITKYGQDSIRFNHDLYWKTVIDQITPECQELTTLIDKYIRIADTCDQKEYNIELRCKSCNYEAYATVWKNGKKTYNNTNDTYKANPNADYQADMFDLQTEQYAKEQCFAQLPYKLQCVLMDCE